MLSCWTPLVNPNFCHVLTLKDWLNNSRFLPTRWADIYRKWCNFLVKRIFWKKKDQNWRKNLQPTLTQMFLKNEQLKMIFRTNRRSLKFTLKEFSKVNECARDPPWCYKNTIFQTTQINYSRQPEVICTNCFLSGSVFVWSSNNGVMLQFQVG